VSDTVVFNHHSLPFPDQESVAGGVTEFIEVALILRRAGKKIILMSPSIDPSWFRIELRPEYHFQDWYNSSKANPKSRDIARRFLSLATSSFLADASLAERVGTLEVGIAEFQKNMEALTTAYVKECPVASFPTHTVWTSAVLDVTVQEITTLGVIETREAKVENFSGLSHVSPAAAVWEHARNSCQSGTDLLREWPDRFPQTVICERLRQQLQKWHHGNRAMQWAWDAIDVLDRYTVVWQNDPSVGFSYDKLRELGLKFEVSGESETVRNTPLLRQAREFFLPSGEKRFFGDHVKFAGGLRLHFLFEPRDSCIYVGYLGRHLPLN